jgi:protein TonB
MSTPAPALPIPRVSRRQRRRRHASNRILLQWRDVPVANSVAFVARTPGKTRRWLLALAVVAMVCAHVIAIWYGNRFSLAPAVKERKTTLAVEFVRPPAPPKIEPPPPPPPPKRAQKAPPPIRAAAVAATEAPSAVPVETVAAVVPEPVAPPMPEPVTPAFGGIGYKNNPPPDYPPLAVRQNWQGTVLLRVRVLATGAVDGVEVVRSSGKKVLDDAAIHTVEHWVFAPSTRGSATIDGFATVPIEFKLDS